MKILFTCFEDFSDVKENSSRLIVESLGLPYLVLPVSFEHCADTLPHDQDFIIQVGVAASRSKISLERYAHNLAHSPIQADNDGKKPLHQAIAATAPIALETTIDLNLLEQTQGDWVWSLSAGSYVCNCLYFKTLWQLKKTKTLFIHVPHHLKNENPKASLAAGRELLLEIWTNISKHKKTGEN